MDFYIPSSLSQDFSDMLDSFGTTVTVNCNTSTPTTAIVQLSNPNFKSNYQNLSDNARILRFALDTNIKKGDYLTDNEEGVTYIVTWQPFRDINSYKSQCQICNTTITIENYQDAVLNNTTGEIIIPAGYVDIVPDIKVFTARNGNGIFSTGVSEIGVTPQNKLMVGTQFNSSTEVIKVGHEFQFRGIQYRITNVDHSQLVDGESRGCLVLYAEQIEGDRRA